MVQSISGTFVFCLFSVAPPWSFSSFPDAPLGDGQDCHVLLLSYCLWIEVDWVWWIFFYIRIGGKKRGVCFFLGGGNTFLVVNKPFGNTFLVFFFVWKVGFWAALKCVLFGGVVWCRDVGRWLKSMRCDFCIQCIYYVGGWLYKVYTRYRIIARWNEISADIPVEPHEAVAEVSKIENL